MRHKEMIYKVIGLEFYGHSEKGGMQNTIGKSKVEQASVFK